MHRFSLIGLLGGFLAVAGGAQNGPVVTEAEFLSVLDEAHPAVRESAEAVGRAEAGVLEARTFSNPELGAVREDPSGPIGQTDILVSWQLPGVERGPRIEAREGEVEAARRRFDHQLLTHRLAMREAYAGWAVAAARQNRLAAQAERVESLAQREAARAEGGEASGLEASRLQLAAATFRSRGCPCRCGGGTGASGGGSLAPGPAGGRAAGPAGTAGRAVAGRGRCADPHGRGRRCCGRTG